jgi:hypothetical protein
MGAAAAAADSSGAVCVLYEYGRREKTCFVSGTIVIGLLLSCVTVLSGGVDASEQQETIFLLDGNKWIAHLPWCAPL